VNEPAAELERPAVSVVMPFRGDARAAAAALEALSSIERVPGDELIVADNTDELTISAIASRWPAIRVVPAIAQRSSYYARNVAAATAANGWMLFIDSDCIPEPAILRHYFAAAVGADEGALAGGVLADPRQHQVLARYQRDRGALDQQRNVGDTYKPFGVTANLLVRTEAWRSVGGFLEGIRSGGDSDFCWRLQEVGWKLGYREAASVVHRHRERWSSFARVTARYAAGRSWLDRRYPELRAARPPVQSAARALGAAARWALAGEPEKARFRAIDAFVIVVGRTGALLENSSKQPPQRSCTTTVVAFTDIFPEISETFIGAELRALALAGEPARVEALRRPQRIDLESAREHRISYGEDDPLAFKLLALAWLVSRHPLRSATDVLSRSRWRREEPVAPLRALAPAVWRLRRGGERHLHAHFAMGAALSAMRIATLTGLPYSVTAHAYDIFQRPCNLREKLERASFVTTGCRYNVEYLERLAPAATVHEIVMGVDGERFRRRTPYSGSRRVVAVGRLVEKKGFGDLIDAVAILTRESTPLDLVQIVGDGPLRGALQDRIDRFGVGASVRLLGALGHQAVRDVVEGADLLAMPCVVAADGDRDSMPVVVKEALALELPVIATDEVGLPELVAPEWGRLVAPGDPEALAAAIAELLALDPEQRIAMGRRGREHVLEHCNVEREGARLAALIADAGRR
jgi:colanic acid/amylovoran biosynthesis glycosyltransferase